MILIIVPSSPRHWECFKIQKKKKKIYIYILGGIKYIVYIFWVQSLPYSVNQTLHLWSSPGVPRNESSDRGRIPGWLRWANPALPTTSSCVVPPVWQDLHERHLSPGPHPAQTYGHGGRWWVQVALLGLCKGLGLCSAGEGHVHHQSCPQNLTIQLRMGGSHVGRGGFRTTCLEKKGWESDR